MKTKEKILLFFSALLVTGFVAFLSSCDPDNLELLPPYETEGDYFDTEDDFSYALYSVYQGFINIYWFNKNSPLGRVWLLPGDDMTTNASSCGFETFSALNSQDWFLNQYWSYNYIIIHRANTLLEKLDQEKGVIKTANIKGYMRGEAKFLKALAHFNVWCIWGDRAPYIQSRVAKISQTLSASADTTGKTVILDSIIADLQKAAAYLPASWDAKYRGRATKDAANGLLGKALVIRGDYNNSTADYTAAITAFNSISATRQLTANFNANFSAATENNSESLFEIQATTPANESFENLWLDTDFDISNGCRSVYYGHFNPTDAIVTIPETGTSVTLANWTFWGAPDGFALTPTLKLFNAFDATDPRRAETCQVYAGSAPQRYSGYTFVKYILRDAAQPLGTSINNPRILRMADILLLKAEATVKSGGSLSTAVGLVNQVRARARNSITPASAAPADRGAAANAAEALGWIRSERFLELAGEEYHRWIDLKRWNKHGDISIATWTSDNNGFSSSIPADGFGFTVFYNNTEGSMNFPIPSGEVDANPNVKQNVGF